MTGFDPTAYDDPRQAELLAWLRTSAPLPLIGADALGIPRDLVVAWLAMPSQFTKEVGKLRSHWIQTQVRTMMDSETSPSAAAKIKWLLAKVDPETFADRQPKRAPDARHRASLHQSPKQGKLDLSKLEEPELD